MGVTDQAKQLVAANELLRSMDLDRLTISEIDRVLMIAGLDPDVIHTFFRQVVKEYSGPGEKPDKVEDQMVWATQFVREAVFELFRSGAGMECVMMALKNSVEEISSLAGKVYAEKQCCNSEGARTKRVSRRTYPRE